MTVSDRRQVLALVAEAVAWGSRQRTACEMVGVAERTLQRWQLPQTAEDGRRGPRTAPHISCPRGSVTRWWRWRHVRSFAMRVRIRSSLVLRTEETTLPQSRPFTAY